MPSRRIPFMRLFYTSALIFFVSAASVLHAFSALSRTQNDTLAASLPAGITLAEICGIDADGQGGAPLCPFCVIGDAALAPDPLGTLGAPDCADLPAQWAASQVLGHAAPNLSSPIRAPPACVI